MTVSEAGLAEDLTTMESTSVAPGMVALKTDPDKVFAILNHVENHSIFDFNVIASLACKCFNKDSLVLVRLSDDSDCIQWCKKNKDGFLLFTT